MTSFIHPGKSPAAIVRRYSFLSGNVMFVMISDPCSVNSELYPTGLKLPSTFKRCISCNAACLRWAVNKYGCYTNKLSVQHGQGSKTPDNTRNTNEDSTSTFTCMKTPFTHSYTKCLALSLVLAQIMPATVSVLLQICAGQTPKAPTANQHCPVSDLQVSLQYVDTFWNFLNKLYSSWTTWPRRRRHHDSLKFEEISSDTLSHPKRLEHSAHWLWEPQLSQKMLTLFFGQNSMSTP